MKSVVLVTGASSGFGALIARQLAKAGHIVYAGMRETNGRNAPRVEEARKYSDENKVDLRTVEIDFQSEASVEKSIQTIVAESGLGMPEGRTAPRAEMVDGFNSGWIHFGVPEQNMWME
jgi:NAD(P)-dependent dehydrogenase (short-subunit alcohol dehydrogenase family)